MTTREQCEARQRCIGAFARASVVFSTASFSTNNCDLHRGQSKCHERRQIQLVRMIFRFGILYAARVRESI